MLRSKTCPIAAGRRSFYSVVVFYFHGCTMGCFRRYIRFVGAKLYLVHLVSGPFRRSVSSVGGDVGGLYDLILVGVDRWLKHSSTLSHEFFHSTECITLVWCPSV